MIVARDVLVFLDRTVSDNFVLLFKYLLANLYCHYKNNLILSETWISCKGTNNNNYTAFYKGALIWCKTIQRRRSRWKRGNSQVCLLKLLLKGGDVIYSLRFSGSEFQSLGAISIDCVVLS